MQSSFTGPVNIGSEEMVTINDLVDLACSFEDLRPEREYRENAPVGVRGRNSDNTLIRRVLNWDYKISLSEGLQKTYYWIQSQLKNS